MSGGSAGPAAAPTAEEYTTQILQPPFSPSMQEEIYRLLLGYGPHYPAHFGRDMQARLSAAASAPGSGLISAVALTSSGTVVAHACTIFDPARPSVGLFGAVFTEPDHRRKGLSEMTVRLSLEAYDAAVASAARVDQIMDTTAAAAPENPGQPRAQSCVVLGTGSPHAARTYQRFGFGHLSGGLEAGKKGYNPDDMGVMFSCPPWLTLCCPLHSQFT